MSYIGTVLKTYPSSNISLGNNIGAVPFILGNNNTLLGFINVTSATTLHNTTSIGWNSGQGITTATAVTLLGSNASASDGLEQAMAIGAGSNVSASGCIALGSGENVGIGGVSAPLATLHVEGSQIVEITEPFSSPYNVDPTSDYVINVNTSGGDFTVNLPTSPAVGLIFYIKDYTGNAASNNIVISAGEGGLIDGSPTLVLSNNYQSVEVVATQTSPAFYSVLGGAGSGGGGGGISSVVGTPGQIDVNTVSGVATVSIDSGYVGQTSITTLGTLSSLNVGGGITVNQYTLVLGPGAYSATASDYIIKFNTAGGAAAVFLPDPTSPGNTGQIYIVKDVAGTAASNNITVYPGGSASIDGNATFVINVNYASITVFSDGTNYFVI